ncbi:MAG: hypothetical protein M3Z64_09305 [Verrucomicrobiota bacterium]|nr:hypothetical protein [Verrucomicrobiota bacterium]
MAKKTLGSVIAFAIVFWITNGAMAAGFSYHARLGEHDHYDQRGRRLTTVRAVLERDRENYHRFHRRDASDGDDSFFTTEARRRLFYRMKIIFKNFGEHPGRAVIGEYLDVDVTVVGLVVYLTVSAG